MTENENWCYTNSELLNKSPLLAELNKRITDILQDMATRYSPEEIHLARHVLARGGLVPMASSCTQESN